MVLLPDIVDTKPTEGFTVIVVEVDAEHPFAVAVN